jgi:hypothetical protein
VKIVQFVDVAQVHFLPVELVLVEILQTHR